MKPEIYKTLYGECYEVVRKTRCFVIVRPIECVNRKPAPGQYTSEEEKRYKVIYHYYEPAPYIRVSGSKAYLYDENKPIRTCIYW